MNDYTWPQRPRAYTSLHLTGYEKVTTTEQGSLLRLLVGTPSSDDLTLVFTRDDRSAALLDEIAAQAAFLADVARAGRVAS